MLAQFIADIFVKDVFTITNLLWTGRREAKRLAKVEQKANGRYPLYGIKLMTGRLYKRLCQRCATTLWNTTNIEKVPSDRGKRRHVYKCEHCGKSAPNGSVGEADPQKKARFSGTLRLR